MCKLNILHNDIKPSNILIFYDESTKLYKLKISDFGMSEILSKKTIIKPKEVEKVNLNL